MLWALIVAMLVALAWLHVCMDGVLDLGASRILDRPAFRSLHRWYLRVTTAQWLACILLTWWTLRAWRDADARRQGPDVSAS